MKLLAALLCAVAVLVGCATSEDAPAFSRAPVPQPTADRAILYMYRVHALPLAWSAFLQIDGQEAASLANQGFTWVYLRPGKHKFQFGWPFLAGMPRVNFERTLEAGRVYAFEMRGDIRGAASSTMELTSAIAPIDFDEARRVMAGCCRYVAPRQSSF